MATTTQRNRLRNDIGADEATLSDTEADAIFTEAGESYTDVPAQTAYTRVIAIRRLLASAAKLTTYQQNQSSEKLSDVFTHLKQLLAFWQGQVDTAVIASSTTSTARFGGVRSKPSRIKEYPSDTGYW